MTALSRSELMARVRQKRTAPELAVARFLAANRVRYRFNVSTLPGTPDLANQARRFAIFVHGCFWHRHRGCARATLPKTNRAFWMAKFAANVRRDRRKGVDLKKLGYRVGVIWECETEDPIALRRILRQLVGSRRQAHGTYP